MHACDTYLVAKSRNTVVNIYLLHGTTSHVVHSNLPTYLYIIIRSRLSSYS